MCLSKQSIREGTHLEFFFVVLMCFIHWGSLLIKLMHSIISRLILHSSQGDICIDLIFVGEENESHMFIWFCLKENNGKYKNIWKGDNGGLSYYLETDVRGSKMHASKLLQTFTTAVVPVSRDFYLQNPWNVLFVSSVISFEFQLINITVILKMCNKLIFGLAFPCLLSFLPLIGLFLNGGRTDIIEKHTKTTLDISTTDSKNNSN